MKKIDEMHKSLGERRERARKEVYLYGYTHAEGKCKGTELHGDVPKTMNHSSHGEEGKRSDCVGPYRDTAWRERCCFLAV